MMTYSQMHAEMVKAANDNKGDVGSVLVPVFRVLRELLDRVEGIEHALARLSKEAPRD